MVTQHKSVSLNSMKELVRSYQVSKSLSFSILPHSYGPNEEAGGDLFQAGLSTTESSSNVSLNASLSRSHLYQLGTA